MIKQLNKQQLAFILDIKAEDARAKMCVAWSRHLGEPNKARFDTVKKKIDDPYPTQMPISVLSAELNLPTLQESVDDIVENYLKRPATKKWILFDYPEKLMQKWIETGESKTLSIPPALRSMIRKEVQEQIVSEWARRYPKITIKE